VIYHSSDWHLDHANVIRHDCRPDADIEAMNARILRTTNECVSEKDWLVFHGDLVVNRGMRDDNTAYIDRVKFFLSQLRCKNVIFIGGNHDRVWERRLGFYRPNWPLWNLFRVWECTSCGQVYDDDQRFGLTTTDACNCDEDHNPIFNFHPMGYELRLTPRTCAEHKVPYEYEGTIVVCTHYSHRVWNRSHHAGKVPAVGKSINLYGHSHGGLPGIKNSFDVSFNVWNRPLSTLEILATLMPKHNSTTAGRTYFGHHEETTNEGEAVTE
jgi:calcineurin-like phosphoesterase family protein